MDPLHSCIALGPLAVYLLLIGLINLSSRPFVTTGARDSAALGIGIGGFVIAGPMELFFPEPATIVFGSYVWLLIVALYGMSFTFLVLTGRPRLVIYNLPRRQLRPVLEELVPELDSDARWAGDSVLLPNLGVNLTMELFGLLRCVQLVSAGPNQDFAGWRRLEIALASRLSQKRSAFNPGGATQIFFALLIILLVTYWLISGRHELAQAALEMLRR